MNNGHLSLPCPALPCQNNDPASHVSDVDLSGTEREDTDTTDGETTANTVSDITHEFINLSIISPITSACSAIDCETEKSKFMLECSKCKKLTHYRCTQLPPYQIALFMRKGYRLYACSLCVGEIDEDIVRNCTVNEDENVNKVLPQENTILVEENRQLKLKINELDMRTVILRKLVKDQEITTNILKQGKKKFTASQTIQTETEPTRVDTTSAEVNCSTVSHPDDEHMKVLTNKLLTQVSKIVDEKLATFGKQLKVIENIPCKVNEKCNSTFSEVLKKNIR